MGNAAILLQLDELNRERDTLLREPDSYEKHAGLRRLFELMRHLTYQLQ